MSKDDPFGLHDLDSDRTMIVRPTPGGARGAGRPGGSAAPPPGPPVDLVATGGGNPLIAAARPILTLAPHLGGTRPPGEPEQLRSRLAGQIAAFRDAALRGGADSQSVEIGAWALAALVDDIVLNTPWGGHSIWATRSLVGTEFKEVNAGERFFERLAEFERDPGRWHDLLALMYCCLALGFKGRYRIDRRLAVSLEEVRAGLYSILHRERPEARDLSPHWQGVPAAHKALAARLPLWVIGVGTLALLALIYTGFSFRLAGYSEQVGPLLQAMPPQSEPALVRGAAPVPVVMPTTVEPPRLLDELLPAVNGFLEPEIAQGLVKTFEDQQSLTIRLNNRGLFPSGSAEVTDRFRPILERIARALDPEPGDIWIIGHTDNVPIRTPRFPSNWELSQARARGVAEALAPHLADPGRMVMEGRADTQPLVSNATAEGRAENRRIEIVLRKEGG